MSGVGPYRLFELLGEHNAALEEAALALTQTPSCMRDRFAKHFLAAYPSVPDLMGAEARVLLLCLARQVTGTTYSTERLHSRNLRRAKGRASTQRINIKDLALPHVAFAGPRYCHKSVQSSRSSNRPGRPKRKSADPDPQLHRPSKKKRTGGGGAWRAYVHLNLGGRQITPAVSMELGAGYRNLTQEQRQHYEDIGRAGPFWATKKLHNKIGGC